MADTRKRPRPHFWGTYLSDEELGELKRAANGMSMAAFLRHAALKTAREQNDEYEPIEKTEQ